jgi:hypothetical protein
MILGVLPKFLDFAYGLVGLTEPMSDQVAAKDCEGLDLVRL